MKVPYLLFNHSIWPNAISQYLIKKALADAYYLPVILLLGTVMQAEKSLSPVQGQLSLTAQLEGSAALLQYKQQVLQQPSQRRQRLLGSHAAVSGSRQLALW